MGMSDTSQLDLVLIVGTAVFVLITAILVALFVFKKDAKSGAKAVKKKAKKTLQDADQTSRSVSFPEDAAPVKAAVKKAAAAPVKAAKTAAKKVAAAAPAKKAAAAKPAAAAKAAAKEAPKKKKAEQAKAQQPQAPVEAEQDLDGFEEVLTKKDKRQKKAALPVVVQTRGMPLVAVNPSANAKKFDPVPATKEPEPEVKSKNQLKKERREKKQAELSQLKVSGQEPKPKQAKKAQIHVDELKHEAVSAAETKVIAEAQDEKDDIRLQIQKATDELGRKERELAHAQRSMREQERTIKKEEKTRKLFETKVAKMEQAEAPAPKKAPAAKKAAPKKAPAKKAVPTTFTPVDVKDGLKRAQELKQQLQQKKQTIDALVQQIE